MPVSGCFHLFVFSLLCLHYSLINYGFRSLTRRNLLKLFKVSTEFHSRFPMSAECLPVVGCERRLLTGRLLIGCGGASGDVVSGPGDSEGVLLSITGRQNKREDKMSALFFLRSSLSESAASFSINFVQFFTSLVHF
jgi:hypothetical protein